MIKEPYSKLLIFNLFSTVMQRRKFLIQSFKTSCAISSIPALYGCTKSQKNDPGERLIKGMIAEIEALVPQLLKAHNVPGISMALIHEGKRAWSKGFGVTRIQAGKPVDADTVFECASISKTVFAYAVMKLCEQGKLELDKPLADYGVIPISDDPRAAKITVRHVLSHQTGLQDWRSSSEPLRISFNPGEGFMYSGEGYFFLQSIITRLMGKTDRSACGKFEADLEVCATDIGEYLEQHVLEPLEMKSSSYITRAKVKENYAFPHNGQGEVLSKPPQGPVDMARYAAAGGLLTTVNDYATFITQLFKPADNNPHRLNQKSLEAMFTPQVKLPVDQKIDGATSWALGWAVQERKDGNVLVHSGGQSGYRSLAMHSPELRSGFVMFTNSDNGGWILYNEELGKILNRILPA
jgi:CubicO group peptidase (beta-lactamase class C family)